MGSRRFQLHVIGLGRPLCVFGVLCIHETLLPVKILLIQLQCCYQ